MAAEQPPPSPQLQPQPSPNETNGIRHKNNNANDNIVLLNTFTIWKKRYRVFYHSAMLVWEKNDNKTGKFLYLCLAMGNIDQYFLVQIYWHFFFNFDNQIFKSSKIITAPNIRFCKKKNIFRSAFPPYARRYGLFILIQCYFNIFVNIK